MLAASDVWSSRGAEAAQPQDSVANPFYINHSNYSASAQSLSLLWERNAACLETASPNQYVYVYWYIQIINLWTHCAASAYEGSSQYSICLWGTDSWQLCLCLNMTRSFPASFEGNTCPQGKHDACSVLTIWRRFLFLLLSASLREGKLCKPFTWRNRTPAGSPCAPSTRTQGPAGSRPVFSCERALRENYFKVFFSYSTQTKSSKHYFYLALYRWLAASLASLLEQDGRHPCHNTGCSSVKLQ